MKMKLFLVSHLMVFMVTMVSAETASTEQIDAVPRTTGSSGINLNGKMFTLSRDSGGITFSRPGYGFHTPHLTRRVKAKASTTPPPITTTAPNTTTTAPNTTTTAPNTTTTAPNTTTTAPNTTTTAPITTTAPNTTTTAPNTTTTAPNTTTTAPNTTTTAATTVSPTRGVSVCVRYVTDTVQRSLQLFTLSPDRSPLSLQGLSDTFVLSYNFYYNVALEAVVSLWPDIKRDIWTSVCLTVDTSKQVVQVFNGGYMSPRKVLPQEYVWSGEPVIDFPGFDGQLTDVQVWDYPLGYRDIFHYMSSSYYRSYSGSALSWSHISYSLTGNAIMEESYDTQAKQAEGEAEAERRPKEEMWRFLSVGGEKRRRFK